MNRDGGRKMCNSEEGEGDHDLGNGQQGEKEPGEEREDGKYSHRSV